MAKLKLRFEYEGDAGSYVSGWLTWVLAVLGILTTVAFGAGWL